jgi:hypothetical protein
VEFFAMVSRLGPDGAALGGVDRYEPRKEIAMRLDMRRSSIALVALCGLALTPSALAHAALPGAVVQAAGLGQAEDRNAALDYWRLMNTTTYAADLPARAGEAFKVLHPDPDGDAQPVEAPATLLPGGELQGELAEIADFLDDLERASRETHCDFQVRYEDGYAAMLPHLGKMRGFARLLVTDARRLALAGDEVAAAERLATALRMARHLTGDRILISSLVSAAIADMAIKEAHWLLDRTDGAGDVRRTLDAALQRFPVEDAYGVEVALRTERDLVASLSRQFRGPRAGSEFADMFLQMAGETDEAVEREVRALDGEAFKAQVERAVDAFDLVFEAWKAADAQAELQGLGERFSEREFGTVALIVVPAFEKAQGSDAKARAKLDALKDRVKGNG